MVKLAAKEHKRMKPGSVLADICHPVADGILRVKRELRTQADQLAKATTLADIGGTGHVEMVIRYFFHATGKLLRPALILMTGRAVGGDGGAGADTMTDDLVALCLAVEFIHCASLIHDDIVDHEIYRRDQLSLNRRFGNRIAVLAGDLLYARSFLIIAGRLDARIGALLSQCIEQMCRGEMNEVRNGYASNDEYEAVLRDKTGSLMSFCCRAAAMLGNVSDETVSRMARFGLNFGMCFQLRDDIIDIDGPAGLEIDLKMRARHYAALARDDLGVLCDSEYKRGLLRLIERVMHDAGED